MLRRWKDQHVTIVLADNVTGLSDAENLIEQAQQLASLYGIFHAAYVSVRLSIYQFSILIYVIMVKLSNYYTQIHRYHDHQLKSKKKQRALQDVVDYILQLIFTGNVFVFSARFSLAQINSYRVTSFLF